MKHDFLKNRKGLSLMEVLVAFVIASMLLLTGVVMVRTAGRLVQKGTDKMSFLQELMYVTTRIEKEASFRSIPAPGGVTYPRIVWGADYIEVQISPLTLPDFTFLSYRYYAAGNVLTEVTNNGTGNVETVISQGLLRPGIWRPVGADDDVETCLTSMTAGACAGFAPVFQLTNPRNAPHNAVNRMLLVSFRSSVDENAWVISQGSTAPRSVQGVTKSVLLSNWREA